MQIQSLWDQHLSQKELSQKGTKSSILPKYIGHNLYKITTVFIAYVNIFVVKEFYNPNLCDRAKNTIQCIRDFCNLDTRKKSTK